jgi:hypothetical protein
MKKQKARLVVLVAFAVVASCLYAAENKGYFGGHDRFQRLLS